MFPLKSGKFKMDKKEAYCSECLKRCGIRNPENPFKAIIRMWCLILSFGWEGYNRTAYSTCCGSKVIYLNTKERILMAL